jgi:hypothetical protein
MVQPYLSALITHTGITYPSSGLVLAQLGVVEPESNLLGSGIERVGSVDQVSAGLLAFLMYAGKAGRYGKGERGRTYPTETAYCPLTDPGSDSWGLVAPTILRYTSVPPHLFREAVHPA